MGISVSKFNIFLRYCNSIHHIARKAKCMRFDSFKFIPFNPRKDDHTYLSLNEDVSPLENHTEQSLVINRVSCFIEGQQNITFYYRRSNHVEV